MGSREKGTGSEICFKKENAWWVPSSTPQVYIAAFLTRKCLTFVFLWPRLYLLEHGKIAKSQSSGQRGGCLTGHCHLRAFACTAEAWHFCRHAIAPNPTYAEEEEKKKKKTMTPFDGSEEDEAAPVLLLTRLSLLSTFVAPQGGRGIINKRLRAHGLLNRNHYTVSCRLQFDRNRIHERANRWTDLCTECSRKSASLKWCNSLDFKCHAGRAKAPNNQKEQRKKLSVLQ